MWVFFRHALWRLWPTQAQTPLVRFAILPYNKSTKTHNNLKQWSTSLTITEQYDVQNNRASYFQRKRKHGINLHLDEGCYVAGPFRCCLHPGRVACDAAVYFSLNRINPARNTINFTSGQIILMKTGRRGLDGLALLSRIDTLRLLCF